MEKRKRGRPRVLPADRLTHKYFRVKAQDWREAVQGARIAGMTLSCELRRVVDHFARIFRASEKKSCE